MYLSIVWTCVMRLFTPLILEPENKEKSRYRELCYWKCLSQWYLCGPGARCGHSWGWGPGLSDGSCPGPGRKEGYGGGEGHEGAWQDSGGAAAAWRTQGSQRARAGRSVIEAATACDLCGARVAFAVSEFKSPKTKRVNSSFIWATWSSKYSFGY